VKEDPTSARTAQQREAARVEAVYSRYLTQPRKQRAWAADNPGNAALREELLAKLLDVGRPQLERDGRILDAGCGSGYWLEALARSGVAAGRLVGVDIRAGRVAPRPGLPEEVELRTADLRELPQPDDSFELVLLFTALSSLASGEDVRRALGEARRVLAPGGAVLVYEPRIPNPFNRETRRIRRGELERGLGGAVAAHPLTPLPPLVRLAGRRAPRAVPALMRLPLPRTHALWAFRASVS
jgi:SAM-dependent methyltransferase